MLYMHKSTADSGVDFTLNQGVPEATITLTGPSVLRVNISHAVTVAAYSGSTLLSTKTFTAAGTGVFLTALPAGTYKLRLTGAPASGFAGRVNLHTGVELQHVNSAGYKPVKHQNSVEHKLTDGSSFMIDFVTEAKYENTLKVNLCEPALTSILETLYNERKPLSFVSEVHPKGEWIVNWTGAWDFKPTTNIIGNGLSGTIHLKEATG